MKRKVHFDDLSVSNKRSKVENSSKEFLKVLHQDSILEYVLVWQAKMLADDNSLFHCNNNMMILYNCNKEIVNMLTNIFGTDNLIDLDMTKTDPFREVVEKKVTPAVIYYSRWTPYINYVKYYSAQICVAFVDMQSVKPDVIRQLSAFNKFDPRESIKFLGDVAVNKTALDSILLQSFNYVVTKNDYMKRFINSELTRKHFLNAENIYPALEKWYTDYYYREHYPLVSVKELRGYLASHGYNTNLDGIRTAPSKTDNMMKPGPYGPGPQILKTCSHEPHMIEEYIKDMIDTTNKPRDRVTWTSLRKSYSMWMECKNCKKATKEMKENAIQHVLDNKIFRFDLIDKQFYGIRIKKSYK